MPEVFESLSILIFLKGSVKIKNMRIGFILNWNVTIMKDGIKKMVNKLKE